MHLSEKTHTSSHSTSVLYLEIILGNLGGLEGMRKHWPVEVGGGGMEEGGRGFGEGIESCRQ